MLARSLGEKVPLNLYCPGVLEVVQEGETFRSFRERPRQKLIRKTKRLHQTNVGVGKLGGGLDLPRGSSLKTTALALTKQSEGGTQEKIPSKL